MAQQDNGGKLIELPDSPYAIYEHFCASGWTDGLPIIPPTEDLVGETLRYTDRAPEDSIADLPPKGGAATAERIAVSGVMAGCKPEYLPVLIAAVDAVAEPQYNLYGRQTTTHPGAHLVIINGPIRNEL
ncbi:MAG: UGSC family (seleno)protein, partial [Methyloligellaceae bacterium]